MKKQARARRAQADSSYLALVEQFPLYSIHNDKQLDNAVAFLNSVFAKGELDAGETLYVETLGDLIEHYESAHIPVPEATDSATLQALMDAHGIKQVELARETGILKSTISQVISGKIKLTRKQVAIFAKYFGVKQGAFPLSLDREDEQRIKRASKIAAKTAGRKHAASA